MKSESTAIPAEVHFGRARLDIPGRRLLIEGAPTAIGARAFELLLALIERRGRVVTKHELLDLVWPGLVVEENNLQVQISTLRKLLGPQVIATVPGYGYQFTAALETPKGQASPAPTRAASAEQSGGGNLPARRPQLIGRDEDLDQLVEAVRRHALVSVTGAGGIGKTQLALAAAQALTDDFADGVWWVELAATRAPGAVANAIAQALHVSAAADESALTLLAMVLRRKRALIVLDNCEHLLDAVSEAASRLLTHCASVSLLLTSQEPLKLPEEHVLRLAPLALPAIGAAATSQAAALRLFIARAIAAEPRLRFDAAALGAAGEICRALDGMPLAIELAAARVPLLGVAGVQQWLNDRFRILTGGARTTLRRHQTLRAALEWSHGLLDENERIVFRRLGVFTGSFSLDYALDVVADARMDRWMAIELLGHLVDKSLLVAELGRVPRYRLLQTTRAFALEQLAATGEADALQRRHAQALHARLAPRAARYWQQTPEELDDSAAELDNLRAALDWAMPGGRDRHLACSLLAVSNWLWHHSGQLREGLSLCRRSVPLPDDLPAPVRARFELTYGRLGYMTHSADCREAALRAATWFRTAGAESACADALIAAAIIGARRGDVAIVNAALEEAEDRLTAEAPPLQRGSLALAQGMRHMMLDQIPQAVAAGLRQADCYRGHPAGAAGVQMALSNAAYWGAWGGLHDQAIETLRQSNDQMGQMGVKHGIGIGEGFLACVLVLRNAPGDAAAALEHGRRGWQDLIRQQWPEWLLLAMAIRLIELGEVEAGLRVLGYYDEIARAEGCTQWPCYERLRDRGLQKARRTLPEERIEQWRSEGGALTPEQVADLAFPGA